LRIIGLADRSMIFVSCNDFRRGCPLSAADDVPVSRLKTGAETTLDVVLLLICSILIAFCEPLWCKWFGITLRQDGSMINMTFRAPRKFTAVTFDPLTSFCD
jgi:hypothetical protein